MSRRNLKSPSKWSKRQTEEVKSLFDTANEHHAAVEAHWGGMLEHARQAGLALLAAHTICGRRSRWGKQVRANFNAKSKETRYNYMRIAKHWDDPRLVEARESGLKINSIRAVMNILRSKRDKPPQPQGAAADGAATAADLADCLRDGIRKQFAAYVRDLDGKELNVLENTFGSLLDDMRRRLRDYVCMVHEYDYYLERDGHSEDDDMMRHPRLNVEVRNKASKDRLIAANERKQLKDRRKASRAADEDRRKASRDRISAANETVDRLTTIQKNKDKRRLGYTDGP